MDLSALNTAQREAVEYNDGPSLVIAGAGSGKTRVLTYKIAYLIEHGMKPWNILALTFTNKAANEMKERIGSLIGTENARYLNMGTFHSVFSRILRAEAAALGFTSQFTIYDESDSRSLLKNIIKELQLDDKIYKPSSVHGRISIAKNNIMLPADYARSSYVQRDADARMEKVSHIYEVYQSRLRQSNAMDFDDLLLYTYLLFRNNEQIRQKYGNRFQFVLVDEYQDTNSVQQNIALQIVQDHHHISVVGDDAQSIYAFRGANIDNILNFQNHFTDSRLFKLEQNYRSTQTIVDAANSLIRHNQRQIPKNVFSQNVQGSPLQLKYCYSDREEAAIVCKDIVSIKRCLNLDYSDFAILYRTNAQSRTLEEQMRKSTIPYRIFGGLSFYQRKEIKDVIAYFRLVINPHDEEALRRIINYPARGIGNTTVEKVFAHANALGVPAWQVVCNPMALGLNVNKGTMNKLIGFTELINSFARADAEDMDDACKLGTRIIKESGVSKDIYSGTEPDDLVRQENLQELIDSMQEFVDTRVEESGTDHIRLSDFLQEVSLMSDLDSDDESDEKVVMMTIHSAKGLEFPVVFVVGMEENIFPSPMCCESQRGIEEERRLLYVAITRAEKLCVLTSAQNRYRYGRMEFDSPSRFLNEIDPTLISVQNIGGSSEPTMPWSRPKRVMDADEPEYMRGRGGRWQNSNPVASQFRADPKPMVTRQSAPEPAVDPFSPSFRSKLESAGADMNKVDSAMTRGGRRLVRVSSTTPHSPVHSPSPASSTVGASSLKVGDRIEHSRFGIGTVIRTEGVGENCKVHVEFVNAGTKQLLVKFAKFRKL